jgi:two-component system, OmpR family, sensor histidine kinase ArlS
MPVKFKITLLFTALVTAILGFVCFSVYYFSSTSRVDAVKTRLTNRAITTARLLTSAQSFSRAMVERIDSLTTLSLKEKSVIAFDHAGDTIYNYTEIPGESLPVSVSVLEDAKVNKRVYFTLGDREAIAYHYTDNNIRLVIAVAALDEEGKENLSKLASILTISFLIAIILTLSIGILFSKQLLLPLKKIATEVEDISAKNLSRRIPTGTAKDEWKELADTLNGLLDRLNKTFELQNTFIANASHELFTPLTAASGQLQVVLQRERAAEEYKSALQSVLEEIQNMNRLTRMLLEFTKASSDKGNLITDHLRADELIMKLPAVINTVNKDYKSTLNFVDLPNNESLLLIFGNEELLFNAIKNIALNACKFADDHTAVITLTTKEKNIVIRIFNKGIKIPVDEIPYIFEPFYRADTSKEGFGLGLSLAQKIIRLHDGTLEVNSFNPNGTEFIITLPAANSNSFLIPS